jgi:hypothetical protein
VEGALGLLVIDPAARRLFRPAWSQLMPTARAASPRVIGRAGRQGIAACRSLSCPWKAPWACW